MSYSANNRDVESSLSVFYFRRVVQGQWVGESYVGGVVTNRYNVMYEYHRVARKQYKYVGLSEADAKQCAADMRQLYTRTVKYQAWNSTVTSHNKQGDWETLGETSTEMSAEIVPRHYGGDLWETTISVNEDSVYMSRTDIPRDYATIFSTERSRGYDGETETGN